MKITKFHMRALAPLLLAALLTGCAGSGHVGESWQCPLAQGTACQSVTEADPAARAPGEGRETKLPAPPRPKETNGSSVLSGLIAWFVDLIRDAGQDEQEVATAEPLVAQPAQAPPAMVEPLSTQAIKGPLIAQNEHLRTKERVARIWIAPYVDTGGVYREGHWVRVVVTPARWRLP